jgi:hypothetical protein
MSDSTGIVPYSILAMATCVIIPTPFSALCSSQAHHTKRNQHKSLCAMRNA